MRRVECFGTRILSHLQPFRNTIDCDHSSRTEHEAASDSELGDWTATPHGNRIAGPDIAVFRSHVPG
jgi:hypothetical protein